MQFGKLRHTIKLQDYSITYDSHRHAIRAYTDVATVRADVRGQYGVEGEFADRVESRTIFRVVIRYRNDVKPQQRIIWHDGCTEHTLEIMQAMDMRGDRRMVTIIAMEVTT